VLAVVSGHLVTSPLTNEPLEHTRLLPNKALKQMIAATMQ